MNVLHFYKTYYPDSMGGVEQVIYQIASATARLGARPVVLSLNKHPKAAPIDMGNHLAYKAKLDMEVASTGFSRASVRMFRELAAEADVVHYHFPWPFMDLVHLTSRLQKPSLVTYHSDIVRQALLLRLYQPLMHCFLGSVDRIVSTSPNYMRTSPVLQQYADKTTVIPIGLDKGSYPQVPDAARRRWQTLLGEPFFLFVGMLRYYKGLNYLLTAMKGAPYRLVIVGAGPVEQALKAQAREAGLTNVVFAGAVSDTDKAALLELCHGVVFPSHLRSEAFGVSLLEGAMYGKPMISCEIGTGTSYINAHGETGLVVPPAEAGAFRAAMDQLWQDPAQARTMGEAALARYQQHFTAEQMGERYHQLYAELLA